MRKILAACASVGLIAGIAALGYSYPVKAQSPDMSKNAQEEQFIAEKMAASSTTALPSPVYTARPLQAADEPYADIDGKQLWQYVWDQANISRKFRDAGHPQYWGRIAGTSGDDEAVQWLLGKFRQIGLSNVHGQTVALLDPQWAPTFWEVAAVDGAQTRKLASAQPPYGAVSTNGKVLDLPVVYVGLGSSEADYAGRDVRGKAVLFVRADPPLMYNVGSRDQFKLAEEHGAAAILGTDLRGGNFKAIAYDTRAKIPVFNLGTEDALAVRDMISKASADTPPHIKIRLDANWVSDEKSSLVWGTLPGVTDETIYVDAHHDGWFDGAGDNASGIATMLGIAEHFAKIPQSKRQRTMIFVGLDGHHSVPNGDYGANWMYANREKLFSKTALLINAEHPAEAIAHSGMTGRTDTVMPMWWYAGGQSRPQLTKIALEALREFGVPLWSEPVCDLLGPKNTVRPITTDARGTVTYPCRGISGDLGPFFRVVPGLIAQSSDFTYMHTDADTPEIVPWTGLQNVARAYSRIIDDVNKIPLSALKRPPEQEYKPAYEMCAAWIKDSSVTCPR